MIHCLKRTAHASEHVGPVSRTYRRRQHGNTFHFNTHPTTQTVMFQNSALNMRMNEDDHCFSASERSYSRPIIALSVSLSYLNYRHIFRQ